MIRHAKEKDIPKILDLLSQVCLVHHEGRPDLFKIGTKYDERELRELLADDNRPILVSENEADEVQGYCFCIFEQHRENPVLTDVKTLYIDDLCIDETLRGKKIGSELYDAAVCLAKDAGCYNVTLNVWSCNEGARRFYEKLGMKPQKTYMEEIL